MAARGPAVPGLRRQALEAAGIALGAWALSILTAAPSLSTFTRALIFSRRSGDFVHQCDHPLTRALGTPLMAYRVFVPMVAHLLGGLIWVDLSLQYVASVAAIAVVAFVVRRRLGPAAAAVAAVLVATSYAVTWPNCLLGYPDSVSHLFAACLLLTRRRWVVAACVACALLTDERFLLELPVVAVWLSSPDPRERGEPGTPFPWPAAAAGVAAWLVARHALTAGWVGPGIAPIQTYAEMKVTLREVRPTDMSWLVWSGNIAESYRWSWILIAAGAARRWSRGYRVQAAALMLFLAASAAATLVVFDVARSMGFTFLALPLALLWLAEGSAREVPRLAVWCAWLCLLTPSFLVVPGYSVWWRPLPMRIYSSLTGVDPIAGWTLVR